jgi:glutamine synthetase type III
VNADTETGPGVFETALAYTDALRLADNAVLFKYLAKSVGMKHGVLPSFMAKPWGNVRPASLHADKQLGGSLKTAWNLPTATGLQWVSTKFLLFYLIEGLPLFLQTRSCLAAG